MDNTSFLYVATQILPAPTRKANCCYNCRRFLEHGMVGIVEGWCTINGDYTLLFDTCDNIDFYVNK